MTTAPLHPLTEKILAGQAPEPLCQAAARGALPVPPEELLRAQVWIAEHGPVTAADTCRDTLRGQSAEAIVPLVARPSCAGEVLEYLVRVRPGDEILMAAIVENPTVSDAMLVHLASAAPAAVLERMVDNQQRLLRTPALVRVLDANPGLPAGARVRLRDVVAETERRERREQARAVAPPEVEVVSAPEPASDTLPEAPTEEGPVGEPAAVVEASAEGDLIFQVMNMSVPDKIKLAMAGGREERRILVRDISKVVALAAVKSPKVKESEIESFAGMRNLVEDVLRVIAESREWTKSYAVIHALCKNPKAPVRRVLTFMSRLTNKDLRLLGIDRNIPEVVRANARRFYMARTQTKTKRPGKK